MAMLCHGSRTYSNLSDCSRDSSSDDLGAASIITVSSIGNCRAFSGSGFQQSQQLTNCSVLSSSEVLLESVYSWHDGRCTEYGSMFSRGDTVATQCESQHAQSFVATTCRPSSVAHPHPVERPARNDSSSRGFIVTSTYESPRDMWPFPQPYRIDFLALGVCISDTNVTSTMYMNYEESPLGTHFRVLYVAYPKDNNCSGEVKEAWWQTYPLGWDWSGGVMEYSYSRSLPSFLVSGIVSLTYVNASMCAEGRMITNGSFYSLNSSAMWWASGLRGNEACEGKH